jgi:hypothetical protein
MKRNELKELIKESIREVLNEDNIIKSLFAESLKSSLQILKDTSANLNVHNSDNLRDNLLYTKKTLINNNQPAKAVEIKKQKLDPMFAKMLDTVDPLRE